MRYEYCQPSQRFFRSCNSKVNVGYGIVPCNQAIKLWQETVSPGKALVIISLEEGNEDKVAGKIDR